MDADTIAQKIAELRTREAAAWFTLKTAEKELKPLVDRLDDLRNQWHGIHQKLQGLELALKEFEPEKDEATV